MRSENFAFLLNLYGYKTYTLIKGYKAYRNFVLSRAFRIEHEANIIILGGETGSGKTEILRKLAEYGEQIIDLEAMAHHKGSAFGSLGEEPQPTQEQFENNLAYELMKLHSLISSSTGENEGGRGMLGLWWLEDESRNIGKNQIPLPLWEIMKSAPLIRIYVPRESRIKRLVAQYGKFSKEELSECILKIQQRLGPQNAKLALEELGKGNLEKVADILLTYYDKAYQYDLEKRKQENIFTLNSETTDASVNAKKVIELVNKKFKKEYV
jgi:tRNA 2-selenouridine synthase